MGIKESKKDGMKAYFDQRIRDCKTREAALQADHRADEAVFCRIRGNVYEIFRTVFAAGEKNGADDERLGEFFLQKLDEIPASWKASLEKARSREDTEKACIEKIKLEAASEIRKTFTDLWEEAV